MERLTERSLALCPPASGRAESHYWAARRLCSRIERLNQNVESAIAAPVKTTDTPVRAATYTDTDCVSRSHTVRAALARFTNAQSSEIRTKKRRTTELASTSAGRGKKSAARRSASGRPAGT